MALNHNGFNKHLTTYKSFKSKSNLFDSVQFYILDRNRFTVKVIFC